MTTPLPAIQCRSATVAYGRDVVLNNIDLNVPRGTLLPLVGPNGAGKTTLLKACLGLVPLRSGEIIRHLGGHPPAYVPQQKQLDPIYPVTVQDIVRMGLYPECGYWKPLSGDQRTRVDAALTQFGLQTCRHRHFGELSGGLRQKTLLARAIVTEADVLMLDEPTAGLDAESEAELLALIQTLHEREGKTVLWVHHRLDQCAKLARKICWVENQTVQIIPASEAVS